jgi:hypothetical protein
MSLLVYPELLLLWRIFFKGHPERMSPFSRNFPKGRCRPAGFTPKKTFPGGTREKFRFFPKESSR